ncbi:SMP-30/gluconolactonase/LRE family protein [Mycolicibacterium moriokaense]|nr:SMP-30/gluconolactonase/LRE family protein [Mycolicibacterium moriokaense]
MPTTSHKPPIDPVRWQPPPIDPLPDVPEADVTVVPLPGNGPEDVVVDAVGQIWTGLDDGRVVRIPPGGEPVVVADTGNRALGMHVARDGRILFCDSPGGLRALDPDSGDIETLVDSVDGRTMLFCSNVTETSDGTIYFTESTSAFTYVHNMGALLEARGRGSLFRLDRDGTVTTLVSGLYFANGVTLTEDESALVFAETLGRRLSKYWLTGPKAGTVTPLAVNLSGMPDNLSTGAGGRIWCAMVARADPRAERLVRSAPILRKLIWRLPSRLHPKPESIVWCVAFDQDSGDVVAGVRSEHPDFGIVTGMVEADGRLWMGTIAYPAVAWADLSATAMR